MTRRTVRVAFAIIAVAAIPLAAFAAGFAGPRYSPNDSLSLTPSVIWNLPSGTQTGARIAIDGEISAGQATVAGDLNMSGNPSKIHVDRAGASALSIGNWSSGQQPFTLTIMGDLAITSFGGNPGQLGRLTVAQICLNNAANPATDCKSSWPLELPQGCQDNDTPRWKSSLNAWVCSSAF